MHAVLTHQHNMTPRWDRFTVLYQRATCRLYPPLSPLLHPKVAKIFWIFWNIFKKKFPPKSEQKKNIRWKCLSRDVRNIQKRYPDSETLTSNTRDQMAWDSVLKHLGLGVRPTSGGCGGVNTKKLKKKKHFLN